MNRTCTAFLILIYILALVLLPVFAQQPTPAPTPALITPAEVARINDAQRTLAQAEADLRAAQANYNAALMQRQLVINRIALEKKLDPAIYNCDEIAPVDEQRQTWAFVPKPTPAKAP